MDGTVDDGQQTPGGGQVISDFKCTQLLVLLQPYKQLGLLLLLCIQHNHKQLARLADSPTSAI
jgi:hypothetical protein